MNLIEAIQEEMNRCRELLKEYEAIGSPGVFAASFLRIEIERAEKAISRGDAVAMLMSLDELKACN